MPRCYSVSLGCPKNRVDSERLLGMPGFGVEIVESPQSADFIFINTCGFIQPAVEESVSTIAQAIEDIRDTRSRPLLVVGGCLVGRYTAEVLGAELPEVDLWLDNRELSKWPELLAKALGMQVLVSLPMTSSVLHQDETRVPSLSRLLSTGPSYAWLKVSDGCRHACSFCTIPSIRGAYHSQPVEPLMAEARQLLDQGVKEIVLVAQDLTAWGHDLAEPRDLRTLLDALLPLSGLHRLRLMYMYPTGLTKELLHYLKDAGAPFIPYFDVPLQHAHPDVLSRMGRPFARNPWQVIERVRSVFPDAILRTSLIAGFPGETEEHFHAMCDFVKDVRFNHLGVFAYQAEEGTPAATMPDQIPETLKEERRDAIMRLQAEISEEWLESYAGERLKILVDAPHDEWPGLHVGRAWFQAPETDGMTYISGPGVVPGALVDAEIVETREYDLVALA